MQHGATDSITGAHGSRRFPSGCSVVLGSPASQKPPTHSIAEIYWPSASALTAVTDNIVPVLGRLA